MSLGVGAWGDMETEAQTCRDALPKAGGTIARGQGHTSIVQSANFLGCPCSMSTKVSRRAKGSRPALIIW